MDSISFQASDASLGDKDCSRIVSDKGNDQGLENQSNTSGDESSRSRNECNDKRTSGDDTDISPSYDTEPMVEMPYTAEYNVFAVDTQHSEQSESIINTCVVETGDCNVIPDSPDMCDNDIQNDQNVIECEDECVALANLIANLKLDIDENKKVQKTLGESNSVRDSCLVALQNKQTEFERYKAFNDRTVDYDKLERKLNETLGLLAQKEIDIKEGLKLKAYEILVVKEKHDELVKQSLLTKSHYEGLVKEKTKVITDLKLKEEKDIDKMISMENQLKFLNKIVYKRSQSIQTIHMLAPKCPTFNGRPTFANPKYLKKAQSEIPCLYEIPHDQSDPANRLVPDREETLTLERESRSKLNKDLVKPYDYTKLNSLYEIFKPPTQEYQIQLAHANEVRKKMWRKSFVKTKPNIFKNIDFLPVSKSISKSRQAYNVMTNNINHLREIVDQAWVKHSKDHFRAPTAHDMEILIKTCLMPLALKTQNDSFTFVHELKQEMHADLKYVESFEKEHNLTNPVTPHSWPQVRKSSFAKPYDVNAPGPSRKSPKHVSFSHYESVGLKRLVHIHTYYLEEAKKKAQLQKEKALNTKPSMQQSVRLPNTANGNNLKPRNFNQQPRNWPPSMSSRVSNRTINIEEPPRNQKPFLKSKDMACSTCKKCIYSESHDGCILNYLSKVHSRASTQKKDAQSHKTTKRYMPVEKKSDYMKHDRQIPTGQKFSPNKSFAVYLKTTPPRSSLIWKPTGRIFTQVGIKWIPIRKSVETRYNTNDSASPLGKETHNSKTVICANSSSLSASTSMASEPISSKGSSNSYESQPETTLRDLPNHIHGRNEHVLRYKRRRLILAESNSLPHAHTQATKTYYKHQDSRINKAQELNIKTSANFDIQDLPKSYQDYQDNDYQGRLLASFQDDA
ncbi:hypothetical protein Tco_0515355 [Tanacetum coccineum]